MTTIALPGRTTSFVAHLSACAIGLFVTACGQPAERSVLANVEACPVVEYAPIWVRDRSVELLPDDPAALGAPGVLVVSLERVDLDCDGRSDLVVQTREGFDSSAGGLWMRGFLRRDGEWTDAFRVRSSVDGVSGVVIAADINGDSRLDVLLLGRDEGGVVPQLLLSRGEGYDLGRIQDVYRLRNESDWPSSCWSRLAPTHVPGGRLRLPRETISPLETRGHGEDCSLPLDTLELRGDSLVRVQ